MVSGSVRTRRRGILSNLGCEIRVSAAGPAANFDNHYGRSPPQGDVQVMTDVSSSDFFARRKRGEVVFNPMNVSHHTLSDTSSPPGATYTKPGWASGQRYWHTGSGFLSYALIGLDLSPDNTQVRLHPGITPPALVSSGTVARVIAEACTKAARSPSEANMLVTLAETQKTLRLLPDLLQSWSRVFRRLSSDELPRRLSRGDLPRELAKARLSTLEREVVTTWLAMRFGLRPLVMDTINAVKAVNKALSSEVEETRLTSRGSASADQSDVTTGYSDVGAWRTHWTRSANHRVSVRAMALWELRLTLSRDLGFSLSAVPEAIVDLARFSFVLNWIVNINDYCSYLGASVDPGLKVAGSCHVLTDERSATWQANGTEMTQPDLVCSPQTSGVVASSTRDVTRVLGLQPGLVVRAQPLRFLQDARLIDAIALIRTLTRSRKVQALARVSKRNPGI